MTCAPRSAGSSPRTAPAAARRTRRRGAARVIDADTLVLIGEDEPDNQLILQTVVETLLGVRTEVAGDGLAVLASVERERPKMILLDLMMPGLDGFQVTRHLKSNPETASIPIVAISAMARPDARET